MRLGSLVLRAMRAFASAKRDIVSVIAGWACGKYALASIWDMDGAIVVYDAATLEEVKRIPMVKPSGKYNVHNKITLSSGTSH